MVTLPLEEIIFLKLSVYLMKRGFAECVRARKDSWRIPEKLYSFLKLPTNLITTGDHRLLLLLLLLQFFLVVLFFVIQLGTFRIFRYWRRNDRLLSRWKTQSSSGSMRSKRWRGVEGIASKGTCLYIACK